MHTPGLLDIDALLDQLTLEQKASLLSGSNDWWTQAIADLDIPSVEVSDGPHGMRRETGVDMVWFSATAFPTASALATSWDTAITEAVAGAIATEAKAQGVQVVLGPGVNIKRSPLCGRNFEYFSEDPHLAGELGLAYVTGAQNQGIGTSLKHFAANNQEVERTRISVEASERTLREIYFPAFERIVTAANPWTVMCSYNRIHGVHASQNHWLLTTILRQEWGYTGLVVSDWNAVHDRVAALKAGLDVEMPGTAGVTDREVVEAVRVGQLDEGLVDRSARRVLDLVNRAMMAGSIGAHNPHVPPTSSGAPADPLAGIDREMLDDHHTLAQEAAASSIALLRNVDHALPLNARAPQRIAVIGDYAARPRIQGGGSAGVDPTRIDVPLDHIRRLASGPVDYAPGYLHFPKSFYQDDISALLLAHGATAEVAPPDSSRRSASLSRDLQLAAKARAVLSGAPSRPAQALANQAVETASTADVIIAFVGLPLAFEQEADDRASLSLPADQQALLGQLAALRDNGARLIVVLNSGSPVTMDPWHDHADAIIQGGLAGQGCGQALARIIFGLVNPSGHLAETYPLALSDTPSYPTWSGERGVVTYGEGVFVGYRWYDEIKRAVRYPFGHGLSYTTFAFSDLALDIVDAEMGEVAVRLTVSNTGDRAGAEVVQLYVGDRAASVSRPVRELRAFSKVHLDSGASERIEFTLTSRDFSWWDTISNTWRREGGQFSIEVGASSRDIRLRQFIDLPDAPFIPALVPDDQL